jgi:NADH-quinone oxidoreductase subunit C
MTLSSAEGGASGDEAVSEPAPDPAAEAAAGGADAAADPAPADDRLRAVLDALAAELGDDLVATEQHREDVWVRVRRQAWRRTAEVCRSLDFEYFCFLSGIDWMPSTSVMRGEVASEVAEDEEADQADAAYPAAADVGGDPGEGGEGEVPPGGEPGSWQTGHGGGDTRFQVFARLYSVRRGFGLILKADLDDEAPAVETWSEVYPGADWHERETWEMYGFDFVGHPHLVHLYLPGEFEGFPLRKDFPLLAREVKPWPGLVDVEPMPESDDEAAMAGAEEGEAS